MDPNKPTNSFKFPFRWVLNRDGIMVQTVDLYDAHIAVQIKEPIKSK